LEQGLARVRALPACAAAPGAEAPELPCARTGQPFFSTRHLTHRYADGTEALSDVTLDIHTGEYVLIAGHNGAGKSTLGKHFLNLLHPTSGEVQVGGSSVEHLPVSGLAQRIGYVAQNPDDQILRLPSGMRLPLPCGLWGTSGGDRGARDGVSERL
jgi:ABC-type transport system involved in cytochrome bd biosynthesis fused ATPase/permease subunit